jgi:hypothetical protein
MLFQLLEDIYFQEENLASYFVKRNIIIDVSKYYLWIFFYILIDMSLGLAFVHSSSCESCVAFGTFQRFTNDLH